MQKLQKAARNNQHVVRLLVIMVCWLIFMAITRFQKFYTFLNFQTIASQFPEFGLMSLGVMLCMITGGIDLSCVGVANLTSILMAMLMTKLAGGADASLGGGWFPVIFLLAMAIGALCGLFSGFLVSRIRIPPILATLGVNELLSGVCIVLTDGAAYSSFPKDMTNALSANIGGVVPVRLLVFIVAAVAVWFMLERTTYGLKLHLLGTSEKVAVYSGLKTNRLLLRTYMTSGILSSLGGLMMLATYASARADYGSQYTLQTILIVVLGGVSPNGGKGRISGVILAIFVLKLLESGINRFQNMSSYYISLIWGGVLILAMMLDYFTSNKRVRS
ncbi:MAG: ABC transporter permease [Oscillospiraceae bacterium]|nr:ABC transporter permease [Oscillospiraceae bacterium]